eukprot:TRINITY_DN111640_c0_g1_i1.p1 TRINITY_DN111640_c0_g1~~TRINITY_DN111640_c0_g1_i1.p1  ORF type:complete len:1055 (-),score=213.79 TRINITY_DN111640_c0_g1_i1:129-3293(-)
MFRRPELHLPRGAHKERFLAFTAEEHAIPSEQVEAPSGRNERRLSAGQDHNREAEEKRGVIFLYADGEDLQPSAREDVSLGQLDGSDVDSVPPPPAPFGFGMGREKSSGSIAGTSVAARSRWSSVDSDSAKLLPDQELLCPTARASAEGTPRSIKRSRSSSLQRKLRLLATEAKVDVGRSQDPPCRCPDKVHVECRAPCGSRRALGINASCPTLPRDGNLLEEKEKSRAMSAASSSKPSRFRVRAYTEPGGAVIRAPQQATTAPRAAGGPAASAWRPASAGGGHHGGAGGDAGAAGSAGGGARGGTAALPAAGRWAVASAHSAAVLPQGSHDSGGEPPMTAAAGADSMPAVSSVGIKAKSTNTAEPPTLPIGGLSPQAAALSLPPSALISPPGSPSRKKVGSPSRVRWASALADTVTEADTPLSFHISPATQDSAQQTDSQAGSPRPIRIQQPERDQGMDAATQTELSKKNESRARLYAKPEPKDVTTQVVAELGIDSSTQTELWLPLQPGSQRSRRRLDEEEFSVWGSRERGVSIVSLDSLDPRCWGGISTPTYQSYMSNAANFAMQNDTGTNSQEGLEKRRLSKMPPSRCASAFMHTVSEADINDENESPDRKQTGTGNSESQEAQTDVAATLEERDSLVRKCEEMRQKAERNEEDLDSARRRIADLEEILRGKLAWMSGAASGAGKTFPMEGKSTEGKLAKRVLSAPGGGVHSGLFLQPADLAVPRQPGLLHLPLPGSNSGSPTLAGGIGFCPSPHTWVSASTDAGDCSVVSQYHDDVSPAAYSDSFEAPGYMPGFRGGVVPVAVVPPQQQQRNHRRMSSWPTAGSVKSTSRATPPVPMLAGVRHCRPSSAAGSTGTTRSVVPTISTSGCTSAASISIGSNSVGHPPSVRLMQARPPPPGPAVAASSPTAAAPARVPGASAATLRPVAAAVPTLASPMPSPVALQRAVSSSASAQVPPLASPRLSPATLEVQRKVSSSSASCTQAAQAAQVRPLASPRPSPLVVPRSMSSSAQSRAESSQTAAGMVNMIKRTYAQVWVLEKEESVLMQAHG